MTSSHRWLCFRVPVLTLLLVCACALFREDAQAGGETGCCLTLEQLQQRSIEELTELFANGQCSPFVGLARGRMLAVSDAHLPRLKVRLTNTVWKGKAAEADGHFVNRWVGGVRAISSDYVIGPSWLDGKLAILMDYAPGTPILGNVHDELREVCPGLFLGPVFERCPCPRLRGFVGVQLECGKPPKAWRRCR
jgi:hypothetical protein